MMSWLAVGDCYVSEKIGRWAIYPEGNKAIGWRRVGRSVFVVAVERQSVIEWRRVRVSI
jgi:hypothetical protein